MRRFERPEVATLLDRLAETPRTLITLFGPRQTGKTTIVMQALARLPYGRARYLAVDQPPAESVSAEQATPVDKLPREATPDWLEARWREARREAEDGRYVVVFDEIQKIPGWSETVKGLWDADRASGCPLHVVLLGSAPLLMQSGLNETLAGRFEPIPVTHWSFREMEEAFGFDLDRYLYFGGYPGTARYVEDIERWRYYVGTSIVEPNIARDILAMTRVRKPALLRNLFRLGADYSGQILSYGKMLGHLQDAGNTTTLTGYLQLLSGAGLVTGLPGHSHQPYRVRASSPKLCVLNTGLMTVGSGYTPAQARADRSYWGRIVESAVGAHLFNTATPGIKVRYWRREPLEVDFVLQRGPHVIAIEVKSGSTGRLRGLQEFERRFTPFRTLLVGEGGIGLRDFLSVPASHWLEEE